MALPQIGPLSALIWEMLLPPTRPTLSEIYGPAAPTRWFHSLELPGGIVTPGAKPRLVLKYEAEQAFQFGLKGKSVLDVGAWDGHFSFEAERCGAARVLATDHFCWSGPGWGTKAPFDFAHGLLNSRVESRDIDLPDLSVEALGDTFDVVLMLGVVYHLPDPLAGVKRVSALAREVLILETPTRWNNIPVPLLRYWPASTLNNDPTNFFTPNTHCLSAMLRECGFSRIIIQPSKIVPRRHFAFAFR